MRMVKLLRVGKEANRGSEKSSARKKVNMCVALGQFDLIAGNTVQGFFSNHDTINVHISIDKNTSIDKNREAIRAGYLGPFAHIISRSLESPR